MTDSPKPRKARKASKPRPRKLEAGRKQKRNQDFVEGTVGQHQIDAWNKLSPEERAWITEQQRVMTGKQWVPPDNPARTPKQGGLPKKTS